jgi:hypothetical protein
MPSNEIYSVMASVREQSIRVCKDASSKRKLTAASSISGYQNLAINQNVISKA